MIKRGFIALLCLFLCITNQTATVFAIEQELTEKERFNTLLSMYGYEPEIYADIDFTQGIYYGDYCKPFDEYKDFEEYIGDFENQLSFHGERFLEEYRYSFESTTELRRSSINK